jgi:molybdopterin converting factor small subunit
VIITVKGVGRYAAQLGPGVSVEFEGDSCSLRDVFERLEKDFGVDLSKTRICGDCTAIVLVDGMRVFDPAHIVAGGARVSILPVVAGG